MSQVPEVLESLVDDVAANMEAHSAMGPLGFRYCEEEGVWEIAVYPTPVELVGGAVDGEVVSPGFTLDLDGLKSAFEQIDSFHWTAHGFGPNDLEGPNISIEGRYRGRAVYLRVLAYAPEDEEPGMKFDTRRETKE